MKRIAVVGDIGSGKSYIAKLFNCPVFNADLEVAKIYKTSKSSFKVLKKKTTKIFFIISSKKRRNYKSYAC